MSANFSSFESFGKQGNFGGGVRKIVYLVAAFFLLLILFATFTTVPAGHRAVVFNNITGGLSARGEGLTLLIPFTQMATIYDVRTVTYTMSKTSNEGEIKGDDSMTTLTSDGQQVDIDLSVRFHPDPNHIVELHRQIGPDYKEKIVRPSARSVTRNAISKYAVIDIYGVKRGLIQDEIGNELRPLLESSFLVLDALFVRNVDFSVEFKKAIEQKQIAQQGAERKKYELEQERIEKERKIVAAEGDAESIRLRGDALARNPALIQYEYVQKITPGVQTIITDGKSILSLGDIVRGSGSKGKQ